MNDTPEVQANGARKPSSIAVSGCRLADGRLHWGHVNGCFLRLAELEGTPVIFVIQDEYPAPRLTMERKRTELERLLGMLYSIPFGSSLLPVLQSTLMPHYTHTLHALSAVSTLGLIEDTLPTKSISRRAFNVAYFSFPLHQVAQILGCGANFVLMNDDNLRFVHLAKRLRKRVANLYPSVDYCRPELVTGAAPRVLGANGKKMSKSNGNAIFIDEPDAEVRRKVDRYFAKGSIALSGARVRIALDEGRDAEIGIDTPLGSLAACASMAYSANNTVSSLRISRSLMDETRENVLGGMAHWTARLASARLQINDGDIWERFHLDQAKAVQFYKPLY